VLPNRELTAVLDGQPAWPTAPAAERIASESRCTIHAISFVSCAPSAPITWELNPSRRRPGRPGLLIPSFGVNR
jgi:hypothetical protein